MIKPTITKARMVELRSLLKQIGKKVSESEIESRSYQFMEGNCLNCGVWVKATNRGKSNIGFFDDGIPRSFIMCYSEYKMACEKGKFSCSTSACPEVNLKYIISEVCRWCCRRIGTRGGH